jgi:hypothetical protein
MRFVRVSSLAVCFLSLSTFPVRCARAGFFRRETLSTLIHLPSSFSSSGYLPGSLWAPLENLIKTHRQLLHQQCAPPIYSLFALPFHRSGNARIGCCTWSMRRSSARICAWVHLEPCFRGVIWNKECCRGSARFSWTVYHWSSHRCIPWSFGQVFTGIWTVKMAAMVNQCAQGVGKTGFRLRAPLWWTMCRVLEGVVVPYHVTVHPLAEDIYISAPVWRCERNPARALSHFPFTSFFTRPGSAGERHCLPAGRTT